MLQNRKENQKLYRTGIHPASKKSPASKLDTTTPIWNAMITIMSV